MIDVSEVVTDPDFAASYTVMRRSGKWLGGRFVVDEPQEIKFYGVVGPTTAKELEQLPEGERFSGAISFHSKKRFYLTQEINGEARVSDEILWNGERYKIIQVKDWSARGYWKAIAVLIGA